MMIRKYAIGIDIGGTKIAVSLGNSGGRILTRREIPTRTGSGAKKSIQETLFAMKEVFLESKIPRNQILGIGVCIPGAVNHKKGIVPRSPNLRGWKGIPIREIIQKAAKLPVFLANDANAAAVGELIFGAGKNTKNFIYITVSTGIGGGIIINGDLYEGSSFVAGEIGHVSVVPDGVLCKCGQRGCLEAYASGTAIAQYVRAKIKKTNTKLRKLLSGGRSFDARHVGAAAREGDKLCLESYHRAAYYLGIGIAGLLNVLNPERVVLGGGVWKSAPDLFWNQMIESCRRHAWPEAFSGVRIVRSQLRGHVGDLGALALVFKNQS